MLAVKSPIYIYIDIGGTLECLYKCFLWRSSWAWLKTKVVNGHFMDFYYFVSLIFWADVLLCCHEHLNMFQFSFPLRDNYATFHMRRWMYRRCVHHARTTCDWHADCCHVLIVFSHEHINFVFLWVRRTDRLQVQTILSFGGRGQQILRRSSQFFFFFFFFFWESLDQVSITVKNGVLFIKC